MNRITLLIFLLSLTVVINAQNSIKGMVTDADNNPLIGASIFLPETNTGTITNKNGNFILNSLPDGNIKIQFSFMGYNTQLLVLKIPLLNNTINVKLTEAIIKTQEVVVSGGYISSQHKNAVKIDVLKAEQIDVSGTPNFMEALTEVSGVDMISKGQGVAKPVIRGLSMSNILVLNNGVRIENYQFSENHPLGIDGSSIDQIEIVKGPASLLYGSDAIGGVLNFIKEKPAPTSKIIGDFKTQLHSNTLGINSSFGLKGSSKQFYGGVRVGMKSHEDYLQGGGKYAPNTRFNEITVNTNAGYRNNFGTFKLYYDYFKQKLGMLVPPVIPLIDKRGRTNDVWYQDLEHHLLSSQNSVNIGNNRWITNIAYQQALRKLNTTLDAPVVEMKLNTITYETKFNFLFNENSEYNIGIQGINQTNENLNNRVAQFLPDANINNIGIFGLIQYSLLKKIRFQGGLRYDLNHIKTYPLGVEGNSKYIAPIDKDFSSFSTSVGVTYYPNNNLIIRANFAKAYRTPNLSELTSNGVHGNRFEIGNENLEPQNSFETDASLHYHGEFLSLDFATFYNKIEKYIFILPTGGTTSSGMEIYQFSQTNAELYGGEVGFHFHPKSAKWLHFETNYSMVIGKQENGNYLPFIPAHKLRYEVRVEKNKLGFLEHPYLKLSALTAFKQNNPSPFETVTDSYNILNFSFGTKIIVFEQLPVLGFSINNLLDTKYFDHLSTLKGMNYYNSGRNISISLTIPFVVK